MAERTRNPRENLGKSHNDIERVKKSPHRDSAWKVGRKKHKKETEERAD